MKLVRKRLYARWPKDGDRLFVESDWARDALVVRDPTERFYRLPLGYKRAGDVLAPWAANSVADRRNVVYAALFCYRQAMELFLKRLLDEFADESSHTHDLLYLWSRFICLANRRATGNSLGEGAMQRLIAEMHDADAKSDGFRYAVDGAHAPFKFGDRGIDLDNLREVMHGVQNFFECAYIAFSHHDRLNSE